MEITKDTAIIESIKAIKEAGELDRKCNTLVGELFSLAVDIADLEYKMLCDLQREVNV